MSVIHSIAHGLVDIGALTPDQRKPIQKAARDEAHALGYWISGCKSNYCCQSPQFDPQGRPIWTSVLSQHMSQHKLTRWNKNTFKEHRRYVGGNKPGVKDRANALHKGTFAECCRALTKLTTKPET